MNIILLSGGSGKRLWPLSNDIRSKQFIKIFKNVQGGRQSMLQRVYQQIKNADPTASITIATSAEQVATIKNQLADNVAISVEPCRRDTFPAIALSACYLHDVLKVAPDEAVVVSPVDPYVDDSYFGAFYSLAALTESEANNLVLMGIEPTYPSEKYGYIIPDSKKSISTVKMFKEKPDSATAQAYINQGALWNGGVFAFKLRYLLEKAHELLDFTDYYDLYCKYKDLQKISFDYAVVEQEPKITVMRYSGQWKDLGTWNTLTEAMDENIVGKGILNATCHNVHVVNELDVPVLCMGLKDVVVSAGHDGILVSDKAESSYIKPLVDNITQPVMYAEKSWGSYQVIDIEPDSLSIKITLKAGSKMNYHSHRHRDEVWTLIQGDGCTVVDGMKQSVHVGDVITIAAGCRHTIIAKTELKIIEVQLGKEISVDDKQRFELEE